MLLEKKESLALIFGHGSTVLNHEMWPNGHNAMGFCLENGGGFNDQSFAREGSGELRRRCEIW